MRHLSFILVSVVAAISAGKSCPAFQQQSATDGTWHPVTAVLGGQELSKEIRDGIVLKLTEDQYDVRVNGRPDKGTCVRDTSTTPHRMTISGTEGPNKGKTLLAIFEMPEADKMRVCYDLGGKAFPTAFKSEHGTTNYLVEYRKELPRETELTGEVIEIPDSDIIELLTAEKKKYRIRLNGIDAPEKAQPFGSESLKELRHLVGQKSVRVVTLGEDRSGQVIADVYFRPENAAKNDPETLLNVAMVRDGFAWHYVRFAPDNKELAAAEQSARTSKRGLWAEENPIAPWEWRKAEEEKRNKK
ncbi:MAG TPA: thermonuclease family protein [Planctomycetaceae bacterium]|nr:thermonuclease family protein [Planctomycetaceae bacterium]